MHPYLRFREQVADATSSHRRWSDADGALPSIFLGHGAPPLLEDAPWMQELHHWALDLPKPKSILIVSAHWESAPLSLSATAAATPLVYDFWGFDPLYETLTYPTPDASVLASEVAAVLPDSEPLHLHPSRGLDHGAWIPLMVMYPHADIPVVQMSIPTHDPQRLIELGRRLQPLREQGTLIVGSGFMTHGLPFLSRDQFTGAAPEPGWSRDFDAWAAEALARGDVETLAAFKHKAPGMPYAHPTVEHFTPLFVTLGAAERVDAPVHTTVEGYFFGLSKRSFQAA